MRPSPASVYRTLIIPNWNPVLIKHQFSLIPSHQSLITTILSVYKSKYRLSGIIQLYPYVICVAVTFPGLFSLFLNYDFLLRNSLRHRRSCKIGTEFLCTFHPGFHPKFYVITVKTGFCQNQEVDVGTLLLSKLRTSLGLYQFLHTPVVVYTVLGSFFWCVDLSNRQIRMWNCSICTRKIPGLFFKLKSHPPPP